MRCTVFVSNTGTANEFAEEVCGQLRTRSVRFFHYVFENTIELGRPWSHGLRERLRASRLFLMLITPAYWESDVCAEEFRLAEELRRQGRLRILPYFVEPGGRSLPLNGRTLYRLPRERWADQIVSDVQGCLARRPEAPEARRPGHPPPARWRMIRRAAHRHRRI
jgi:TIR domain